MNGVDTSPAWRGTVPCAAAEVADDTGLTFTQLANTLYESGSRVVGTLHSIGTVPLPTKRLSPAQTQTKITQKRKTTAWCLSVCLSVLSFVSDVTANRLLGRV